MKYAAVKTQAILGTFEYSQAEANAILNRHGVAQAAPADPAPVVTGVVDLLPVVDVTDYPEPARFYHIGQPVLTVAADGQAVEESRPVNPYGMDYLQGLALDDLAAHRYQVETGGITLPDGSRIHTDRGSQAQLASAYQSLTQPFVASIDWKGPDGWVNVTEVELRPIAEAVAKHVQGCFTAERRVSEQQIDAASTVDDLVAIDLEAAFAAELEAIKAA
tara:strand:- start:19158 stop:19814 length:657 start_codon:yes stop_codon:yes gene_type:complete